MHNSGNLSFEILTALPPRTCIIRTGNIFKQYFLIELMDCLTTEFPEEEDNPGIHIYAQIYREHQTKYYIFALGYESCIKELPSSRLEGLINDFNNFLSEKPNLQGVQVKWHVPPYLQRIVSQADLTAQNDGLPAAYDYETLSIEERERIQRELKRNVKINLCDEE